MPSEATRVGGGDRGANPPHRASLRSGRPSPPLATLVGEGETRIYHLTHSCPGRGTRFMMVRVKPPSTMISSPVTYEARSLARNMTASAMSCGLAMRRIVKGLSHRRDHHARADDIAADTVRPPFAGELARQHDDAGLADAVGAAL